ncbi:type III effector protein [Streptomyces sp. NBC_01280]|uniref:type III effector protein n=1 Tax=unclassified Streptomyces TaxID=2593676 RepID=UPI002E328A5F|nr:type III effector protein [Streptomyces sp. NBC_01280]WSE12009.1 type III effector protein [Streptomyces sp. NBC_01397]WSE19617.1 type III effector protein [Streptomyces sp. NBC_01397]
MNASSAPRGPTSFLAAAQALNTIDEAVRTAQTPQAENRPQDAQAGADQALAALLLLRELRDQLAGWEPGLIEAARAAGSSWADLAHPLGVASRQAAERRYLRVRPGAPGATGEQRVQATRSRRAADRTVSAWARTNAAHLRQLAGQITALTDLPAQAQQPLARLTEALADNDAANLIDPLADTHSHLMASHPDLAARIDLVTRNAARLHNGSTHG